MPPKRLSPFIAKKIGNWDGALDFFAQMGLRVKTVTLKSQEQICKKIKDALIHHILAQDINWTKLSNATQKRKNQSHKTDVLIDTELYIKNIIAYRSNNTWMVGIKKGIAYRRKGSFVNLDRVAVMNEFGNMRVPERPLWEPTIQEFGGPKGIRNWIALQIYEKLVQQARGKPISITKKDIINQISSKLK